MLFISPIYYSDVTNVLQLMEMTFACLYRPTYAAEVNYEY